MAPPPHDERPPGADDPAQGGGAPGGWGDEVSAYLDGELTDDEIAAFEEELERNAALRGELDEIREVSEWLAAEGPTDAPMGFANRVMARIDEEYPAPAPWWAWLRRPFGLPLEGVVVALSAALVLLLVLPRTAPPSDPELTERPARQARLEDKKKVADEAPEEAEGIDVDALDATNTAVPEPPSKTVPATKTARNAEPVGYETSLGAKGNAKTKDGPTKADRPPAVERKPLPTDAEHVPSPSDVGTPLAQAPYARPSPTTAEQAMLEARTLPIDVSSDDPKMLARVLKVAARFGGAKDAEGREIEDPTMDQPVRDVFVQVPQDQLLDFERQLRGFGYRVLVPQERGLLAGNTVTVQLRLTRQPGTVPRKRAPVDAFELK